MRGSQFGLAIFLGTLLLYPLCLQSSERDQLMLIGTIGAAGSSSKALIKNQVTGKLKTYSEGDAILLADQGYAIIKAVSTCMVVLKMNSRYQTIQCDDLQRERTFGAPSPLARFHIIDDSPPNLIITGDSIDYDDFESRFEDEILRASKRYGVDPYLVKAVIKVESNFNPRALSPKNAMGIMQLIPATASIYGVEDPFDAADNIDGGVRHLRDLIEYFEGDLRLVLSAYNAGRDAVIKYGYDIPPFPETQAYVGKVLSYYGKIKDKTKVSWR